MSEIRDGEEMSAAETECHQIESDSEHQVVESTCKSATKIKWIQSMASKYSMSSPF